MSHLSIARHLVKRERTEKAKVTNRWRRWACVVTSRAGPGMVLEWAIARLIEMCTKHKISLLIKQYSAGELAAIYRRKRSAKEKQYYANIRTRNQACSLRQGNVMVKSETTLPCSVRIIRRCAEKGGSGTAGRGMLASMCREWRKYEK